MPAPTSASCSESCLKNTVHIQRHILFLVLHHINNNKTIIMMEVVFLFYFHQKREREKAYLCIYA